MSDAFLNTNAISPRPMRAWASEANMLQWQVTCPVCGEVGLDRAELGGDHESVLVHPDHDAYDSPLGTRGGYVQVNLRCPGAHLFALMIANHKGTEVIGMVPLLEPQPH